MVSAGKTAPEAKADGVRGQAEHRLSVSVGHERFGAAANDGI